MPSPAYIESDYDPWEMPHTPSEVMGRGPGSRKSKTQIPDMAMAAHLALIAGHCKRLMEMFRNCHAAHYTVEREVELQGGEVIKETVPEVLSDAQIRAKYPVVEEWERMHQEQVEHYVSVGGFSIRSATSYEDPERRDRGRESSAGADRRQGNSEGHGEQPRWQ